MNRFFAVSVVSILAVLSASTSVHAHSHTKLCETTPADKQLGSFIATDKTSNFVGVGKTEDFLKGRNNRYLVNQHNGQPIVMSQSCEGKMIADNGPKLKGLLITTPDFYKNKMQSQFNTPGYFVKNLPILTNDEFIDEHMQEYGERTVDDALLNDIIRDTVVFMRDKNQPVVDVYFPEQDVTDGFIVALVNRAVIDKVVVNGNEYYSDEEILQFVSAQSGDYIWSDDLSKDMRWINSYPYRQVDTIFKPGSKPNTTDLILETKDMNPFRLFGGIDNYGSKTTSQNQMFAGFSYGDLWDMDHEFIYSFGAGFDFANFNSHTIQYIAPIPSQRSKLSFTGNLSTSEPRSTGPISSEGTNYAVNINYETPFYDYGFRGFTQSVDYGIDWKRLENDIEFGGVNIFASAPEIAQAYVKYEGTKTSAKTLNTVSATIISSPGDITGNNSEDAFEAARAGADPDYTYGKGLFETKYTDENTNLTFSGLFRGQASNERLLSSEQAAISGPGSVRGFSDNSIRRDNAFLSTFEVASPYIPVVDELIGNITRDRLQGFVFYDRGHGSNVSSSGDGINLDSAGVGVRFGINRNLSGVVEFGKEVHDELNDGLDQKVNFRLNASY